MRQKTRESAPATADEIENLREALSDSDDNQPAAIAEPPAPIDHAELTALLLDQGENQLAASHEWARLLGIDQSLITNAEAANKLRETSRAISRQYHQQGFSAAAILKWLIAENIPYNLNREIAKAWADARPEEIFTADAAGDSNQIERKYGITTETLRTARNQGHLKSGGLHYLRGSELVEWLTKYTVKQKWPLSVAVHVANKRQAIARELEATKPPELTPADRLCQKIEANQRVQAEAEIKGREQMLQEYGIILQRRYTPDPSDIDALSILADELKFSTEKIRQDVALLDQIDELAKLAAAPRQEAVDEIDAAVNDLKSIETRHKKELEAARRRYSEGLRRNRGIGEAKIRLRELRRERPELFPATEPATANA